MPKATRDTKLTDPIQAKDLFGDFAKEIAVAPLSSIEKGTNPSTVTKYQFDPSDPYYKNVKDPTPFTTGVDSMNYNSQTGLGLLKNTLTQGVANTLSGIGQSIANLFDLHAAAKTAEGIITGSNDDFDASFLGVKTSDMANWAANTAKNNPIYEKNPDSLDYTDPAKWANQIAQMGTSVGMAVGAIGSTIGIEALTGGVGTAGVVAKLGQLGKTLFSGADAAEKVAQAYSISKGLKGAAMIYGVLNRYSESRMEAQQTHQQVYDDLSKEHPEYSEEKKQQLASSAARKDFGLNELLTPLDILGYRMMVFNPISGAAEGGLIEPLLEKVAGASSKSALRRGAGWIASKALGAIPEGIEEQSQQYFQDEGAHYAKVLAGMDDGSNFLQRFGKSISTNDSINQGIGGFLGGLVLGPIMDASGRMINGNREGKKAAAYKDYIKEIVPMHNLMMNNAKELETKGDFVGAEKIRKDFNSYVALSNKHIDEQNGATTATDNRLSFLTDVLDQAKNDKFDNLKDLGIEATPETKQHILDNYQGYINDTHEINKIYDTVKDQYNANFVPQITQAHFRLGKLIGLQEENNTELNKAKDNLAQYNLLSQQGKFRYDNEFELRSLQHEKARLHERLNKTDNEFEKENVNKAIGEVENKLSDIANKVDSMSTDESYDTKTRQTDNDIIGSLVRTQDYQSLIHDKNALDHEISLQRKNIGLWNNKKYLQSQKEEAVKKARTEQQIATVTDNTTAEAVKEKEAQLKAKQAQDELDAQREVALKAKAQQDADVEAAKNIVNSTTLNQDTPSPPPPDATSTQQTFNNDSLLGDAFDKVDVETNGTENATENTDEEKDIANMPLSFNPLVIDTNKLTDEKKSQLKNAVKGMVDNLNEGHKTFEDLVKASVKVRGKEATDKKYQMLEEGWKLNFGENPDPNRDIYKKIILSPDEEFDALADDLLSTEEEKAKVETETANDKIEQKTAEDLKPAIVFGADNQLIKQETFENDTLDLTKTTEVKPSEYSTNNTNPYAVRVTKASKEVYATDENGNITVSHEYIEDDLQENEFINPFKILDNEAYLEGSQLELRVPPDRIIDNILVTVFNEDGSKDPNRKPITWKQWKLDNPQFTPDTQEYQDKIPILHYDIGTPVGEKGIAFVRDVQWYSIHRFNATSPEQMQEAIENTRAIRKAVLENNGKHLVTITENRFTTFDPFKTKTDGFLSDGRPKHTFISYKEANPSAIFAVADNDNNLSFNNKTKALNNDENVIIRNKDLMVGGVYELRPIGYKEGKKAWLVMEVAPQPINKEIQQTIVQALKIYVSRNHPEFEKLYSKAKKDIIDTTGIDITSDRGIYDFLNLYINTINLEDKNKKLQYDPSDPAGQDKAAKQRVTELSDARVAKGGKPIKGYVSFLTGGKVIFGINGTEFYNFAIPNGKNIDQISKAVNKIDALNNWSFTIDGQRSSVLASHKLNYNIRASQPETNRPVVNIDKDGNVTKVADSYKEHILQNFNTNVKAVNIGTEEKPNYVTAEKMISYKLSNKEAEAASQTIPTGKDAVPVVKIETKPIEEIVKDIAQPTQEELDKILAEALARLQYKKDDDYSFSPSVLTTEQRDNATEDLDRIGDLSEAEEKQLVDFFTNQIFALLENTESIDKAQVENTVKQIFENSVEPLISKYKEDISYAQDLLTKFASLSNSDLPDAIRQNQQRIARIEATKTDLNKLIIKSLAEVEKTSGVKVIKELSEYEDNSESNEEQDDREENGDENNGIIAKESITVNPENGVTTLIRKYLKNIEAVDKNGKAITGVFGLPTYEDSSNLIQILQAKLAGTPASFDTMLANLRENFQDYNWQKNLLNKLENANQEIKNQFTRVMSMSPLRMKFTMITYNKKDNTFKTSLWDAAEGGVTDAILADWNRRFNVSGLVMAGETNDEGNAKLNKEYAKSLISEYNGWIGDSLKTVTSDLTSILSKLGRVKKGYGVTVNPTGALLNELKTNIVKIGDRMRFMVGTQNYQIENEGNNNFKVSFLESVRANEKDVDKWLNKFGIFLSPKTLIELRNATNDDTKGLYHNYKRSTWNNLFDKQSGLIGILASKLNNLVEKQGDHFFDISGSKPLNEGVVRSLATLETKYDTTHIPHGGRNGGKSFYSTTLPKYITDRAAELTQQDSKYRDELAKVSFSKYSMWLQAVLGDEDNRQRFGVSHMAFDAMQVLASRDKSDKGITKLAELDYVVATEGLFFSLDKGEAVINKINRKLTGTDLFIRWATMMSPTMSDKTQAIPIETIVLDLQNKDLLDGKGISDEVAKVLYSQAIKPELARIVNFYRNIQETNIKSYDKGAGMFYFIPKMNTLAHTTGGSLLDTIKKTNITLAEIEANEDLMNSIYQTVKDTIENQKNEKLKSWERNGILTKDEKTGETKLQYIDNDYLTNTNKFSGNSTIEQKADMAAYDLVTNEIISLANSFMLFAGDPAQAYKLESSTVAKEKETGVIDYTQRVKDTFTNVGKRLADQIAPRSRVPDAKGDEHYIQLMLADRKSIADREFIKFSTKINDRHEISDKDFDFIEKYLSDEEFQTDANSIFFEALMNKYKNSKGFFEIEASDAQEYTTWKEHLDLLSRMGKLHNSIIEITADEIQEAKNLFSSGKSKKDLSEREKKLIGKVMQPMKPVYTGHILDEAQDVMRHVYIKSSSFPLIPQLTEGFEIDKLRDSMEKIQDKQLMNVRASYQSANKVGALSKAKEVWNNNGLANDLNDLNKFSLVLPRKNFGIQQEVPFKSGKSKEDKVSYGTQLMKIIGAIIQQFDNYTYQSKDNISGQDLYKEFNDLHIKLINSKKQQLFDELGLDSTGTPINNLKTARKVQKLLLSEAESRGYPKQTLKGLELRQTTGKNGVKQDTEDFILPLWASINSDKFESLLNAIVTNRIAKIKFPGASYVAGSPEGFVATQTEEQAISNSKMVFTSAWNGQSLQASFYTDENGKTKVKKAQVFVASKFRDNKGNLIDLFEQVDGKYKYINEANGKYTIKNNMFSDELFRLTSFRIPTTGIGSGSQIEIAGFLPAQQGDLMILPSVFTKIKGLDFDVDKENTYQYWHHQLPTGKFEKLSEKHKANILAQYDENLKDIKEVGKFNSIFNQLSQGAETEDYTQEEIDAQKPLKNVDIKLTDKINQNKILEIYEAVYSNPHEELQSKINGILNTDYTEAQANLIDEAINSNNKNEYWTPLSGEYNKQKLQLGANGGLGKGAYSMDVTFHALAQQLHKQDKPITLQSLVGEQIEVKKWKFGTTESTGILGETDSRNGGRSISKILDETAQIGVDNEKLQIMGRVNMNSFTLDVQKVFNLLGLDKGEDGNSIPFLFMSQPILREYVAKLSNAKSSLGKLIKYESLDDAKLRIQTELLNKYLGETTDINEEKKDMSNDMSTKNMLTAIRDNGKDGKLQAAILQRFLEMEEYGLAIRTIQTTLNVESKGLGKSFFDVIDKRDKLDAIGSTSDSKGNLKKLSNVKELIGDYQEADKGSDKYNELISDGYHDMGKYLVKPTTLVGAYNINAVSTAYNMWNKHIPFDSLVMRTLFDEMLPLLDIDKTDGGTRVTEAKQTIFAEFKKFIATHPMAGMLGDETANEVRRDLFIDSEAKPEIETKVIGIDDFGNEVTEDVPTGRTTKANTSLATYIQGLFETKGNLIIDRFIKTNKFLGSLEFDTKKDGTISKIIFQNTKGESYDEDYIYNSFLSLLQVQGKSGSIQLPMIGNKQYTLDTLAQALASYAYLGNAKQEAIQFTKYIPVSYLNEVKFSFIMRAIHAKMNTQNGLNDFKLGTKEGLSKQDIADKAHIVAPIITQIIQHKPDLVKGQAKFTSKEFNKEFTENKQNKTFTSKGDINYPFVTVYDAGAKTNIKFRIFKLVGKDTVTKQFAYTEIPKLGTFGMDEYQAGQEIGKSIINGQVETQYDIAPIVSNTEAQETEVSSDPYDIASGSIKTVLENILAKNNSGSSTIIKEILPFIPEGLIIQFGNELNGITNFNGVFDHNTNVITIKPDTYTRLGEGGFIRMLLEEVFHGLTVNQIKPYISTNIDGIVNTKADAPRYVTDIVRLYNEVRLKSDPKEIDRVLNKNRVLKQALTPDELKLYSLTDIYEFMARAWTNKDFQEYLSKAEFKQTGKTLLEKFQEFVTNILKAIGLNVEPNTALAQVISSTFELIQNENKSFEDINSMLMQDAENMYQEVLNSEATDQNDLQKKDSIVNLNSNLSDDDIKNNTLFNLNTSTTFPTKELDIKNEKCI